MAPAELGHSRVVGASPKVIAIPRNPEALAPGELTDCELADQFGEHERRVKKFKPTADRHGELKKEIQARCLEKPAERATFLEGATWRAEASARAFETTIPPPSAIHRMFRAAKKDFYAACTVTLKAIKENLGEATLERISTKEQTGNRLITAVLLETPAA